MKKFFFVLALAAAIAGANQTASAQAGTGAAAQFLEAARSAVDPKLGDIGSELAGKAEQLGALLATNSAIKAKLDSTLKSLTGGQDSAALASAFDLVKGAKPTAEQLALAKQVGNLASAYAVQKNFASLTGAQGDVATIVSSLRENKITAAIPAIKNVAGNAHLTDGQKQLITSVADKYAPGWQKAKGAVDSFHKLSGF